MRVSNRVGRILGGSDAQATIHIICRLPRTFDLALDMRRPFRLASSYRIDSRLTQSSGWKNNHWAILAVLYQQHIQTFSSALALRSTSGKWQGTKREHRDLWCKGDTSNLRTQKITSQQGHTCSKEETERAFNSELLCALVQRGIYHYSTDPQWYNPEVRRTSAATRERNNGEESSGILQVDFTVKK